MPTTMLRKHPRASSSDSSDSAYNNDRIRKRKRVPNPHRSLKRTSRAEQTFSQTFAEAILERKATPPRPSISPGTPDKLTSLLNKIDTLITADDTLTAYRKLQIILRDEDMQKGASRESLLRILKFMLLLGDGKKQSIEQARLINAARRREMELESEVKKLVEENLTLSVAGRGKNGV